MLRPPFRLAFVVAVVSSLAVPALAAEKPLTGRVDLPVMALRLGEHPDFDRVVFDAPKGATYTMKRTENSVTVSFSLAAKVTLPVKPLRRAKAFAVVGGADGQGPLSVRFAIDPHAVVKDFMSGPSIVIDLKGPEAEEAAQKPKEPMPTKEPALPPASAPKEEKSALSPQEITPAPLPPVQPKSQPKPEPVREPLPVPASVPVLDSPPSSGLAPAPQPAPVPVVAAPQSLPEQKPEPFHSLTPTIHSDPKALEQIRTVLNEASPKPVAILDPKVSVGTAIFARGGYVTILFDRKLVRESLIGSPPPRVKLEPLELPQNTGFRISIPDGVSVRATRKETAWEIYLVRGGQEGSLSTDFIAQPDFALGARLLVASGNPPTPVFFPDPVVGDDLIVLPLRETGAFSVRRRMADFQVVPAAQGLVIKPMHEKVIARVTPDGVELTAEGGLKLSPAQDTGQFSGDKHGLSNGKMLYDFKKWGGGAGAIFSETRHKLMQTIVDVSEDERVLARLDLARFYFTHGMGREALSLLSVLVSKLPEIEAHPDFLAVRGGANVLAGRYAEAMQDFSHPSLRDQPEAILWKAMASAGLRDWNAALEQFSLTMDILLDYPEPMRSRFAVLAIESAAALGKDQKVLDWITRLEKGGYAASAEPALRYLRGVLYSKAGRADMAEKLWHQVAGGSDRLYKIRGELALVDLGVATRSLTPKQAVERLEGLRFAWRGDDLEFDILKRLGGFYIDAKNFRAGFSVLSQALRLFPTSPQTQPLRADMTRTFHDIFMTDLGANLSPIDALSLYTDFKALIPAGEGGNEVRRNLAERLIDIDLLDQASRLLDDLFKNAAMPEERVATATRLAAVKLLDHKADAALGYLDQSQAEAAKMPQAAQDERQLLRVRALSETGKYADALAALPHNLDKATLLLRADIGVRAKNWADATKALMELVGPPDPEKPLAEDKASWLVHAAVAMAQSADTAGLDRLAIDYGAAMDRTGKANLFKVLTRPEKMTQMKDIRAAQSKLTEVDIFRGVLDSYRVNAKK